MEFKLTNYEPVKAIDFNYEELKAELTEKVEVYQRIVYTDDSIKAAKSDRAELNRMKKALNDKRIEIQKEFMKPFDGFKEHIDELIGLINKSVENVDAQVKAFETKVKADKERELKALFDVKNTFVWLTFEKILDQKWLNASTTMGAIDNEMNLILSGIEVNLNSLKGLEHEFEATERYKETLSIAEALNENRRLTELAKKKSELETKEENPFIEVSNVEFKPEEPGEWMNLKVKINSAQYDALTEWMNGQGIEWSME